MEDDNNPLVSRHRRTSIVYLDATERPMKRQRTRKKKLYKVIKRVIEIKPPAKFSTQPNHRKEQKHRKDHNEKHKKQKGLGHDEGWKTWKREKHAESSRMSNSKSQEGDKRNPVDIIVHIKMKE
ncbi:uncharacterized protein LOC126377245 [Pectinophora gossypiella]|uniref:uncharacterized protein LOC126377245 n=1 Tax=Pectinophora gossypiella TaxID=13191 RepID=UPI00214E6B12|nr:uncharacterized protein LOC126377245 [Pectinophora gossypiella]